MVGQSPSESSTFPRTCCRSTRVPSTPALHRLEHQNWIEAEWKVSELGRRAKYYRLTTSGRKQLAIEAHEWDRMQHAVSRVMKLA